MTYHRASASGLHGFNTSTKPRGVPPVQPQVPTVPAFKMQFQPAAQIKPAFQMQFQPTFISASVDAAIAAGAGAAARSTFDAIVPSNCAAVIARDAALPRWEPPPALLPAGSFVAYVVPVVKWDDAAAGSQPYRKLMGEMAFPGPGYTARMNKALSNEQANIAKYGPLPTQAQLDEFAANQRRTGGAPGASANWRIGAILQEFRARKMPGVAGTPADISNRIGTVTPFWFERPGDRASRGALVMVVQVTAETNTEALTEWVQVNMSRAIMDNKMESIFPLPVLLGFKSWSDRTSQAQIADAVERVRRSLGQLAVGFTVGLQGLTKLRQKLATSELKLIAVVQQVRSGITAAAAAPALTASLDAATATLATLPASVTEISQLEPARKTVSDILRVADGADRQLALIQLAISRGPTIGQEMSALRAEYTPEKVIAIAMPEAEALAARAPFAEQAERTRCSALSQLKQAAGNAFDSLARATTEALQISSTLDLPGLQAAANSVSERVAALRAAAAAASAGLDEKEKELGLDFYLRNFYGLPVWAWGAGGAAVLLGGALIVRRIKNK